MDCNNKLANSIIYLLTSIDEKNFVLKDNV